MHNRGMLAMLLILPSTAGDGMLLRIDHQFDAPGDPHGVFDSRFNDPEALKAFGYNGT